MIWLMKWNVLAYVESHYAPVVGHCEGCTAFFFNNLSRCAFLEGNGS
jgi:hypothetical protein